MRIQINKKLAEMVFLILMLLCMYAEAHKDTEFVHEETKVNLQKILDKTRVLDGIESEDRGSIATSGTESSSQNTTQETNTTKPAKPMTFWSGVIDSLSMIFFVEFGDRV